MIPVDQIKLDFSENSLSLLNVLIGLVMFGVALDMKLSDFKHVFFSPKATLIGLGSQFLLLPAFSFLMTLVLDPAPSVAMGMILVAACPGGNVSNFLTHLAKGNTALSVSMTAISTAAAVIMTPFNITFWGSMHPKASTILQQVQLNPLEMFFSIVIILGIPLSIGLFISHKFPKFADKVKTPMKYISIGFFILFIIFALKANWNYFLEYLGLFMGVVFLQNGMALILGYFAARFTGLSEKDSRAVSIEVGIQNSGLGLILIFSFFGGLGGMAIIAAWWGVWHIISGLSLAAFWSFRPPK